MGTGAVGVEVRGPQPKPERVRRAVAPSVPLGVTDVVRVRAQREGENEALVRRRPRLVRAARASACHAEGGCPRSGAIDRLGSPGAPRSNSLDKFGRPLASFSQTRARMA